MRLRHLSVLAVAALCVLAAGCSEEEAKNSDTSASTKQEATTGQSAAPAPATAKARSKPKIAKPTGPPPKKLVKEDLIVGKGSPAKPGDQLEVNYVGVNYKNGKEFDSSFKAGQPFPFQLGAGMVIPGWDQGLVGMKVGGRRKLTIPPELAYGTAGSPPAIGPNETLIFVIDLLRKQ